MSWRTTIGKNLQELRFQFCQTSEGSKGVREFIFAHYQEMKKANPRFPFLIRECERLPARAIARFDFGKEIPIPLDGLDKDAVDKRLAEVVGWGTVMPRSTESEGSFRTSLISTIAVDNAGERMYLGLTDGQLEEHRVHTLEQEVRVSLGARKHVGKKAVTAIVHIEAAKQLATLCDGVLQLLDQETLEGKHVPGPKGLTAIALESGQARRPRLAAAARTGKRSAAVVVYEIFPGVAALGPAARCVSQAELAEPLSVKGMAWLGGRLVVATSLRYMLLDPASGAYVQLFALPEEAPPPTLVQAIPGADLAVLLMDQAGIVVDAQGRPATSALTFPDTPLALAAAGIYVLAACADAVHVYDRTAAAWVQTLPYLGNARAAPGQQLASAQGARGACVLIAGFRRVWLYRPVALEEQARELLRARQYSAALALADVGAAAGGAWAPIAFAEGAFLLLHELHFQEAMDALRRCSPTPVQPAALFPLFPGAAAPWATAAPAPHLWGLHAPLPELRSLISRRRGGGGNRAAAVHGSGLRNGEAAEPVGDAAAAVRIGAGGGAGRGAGPASGNGLADADMAREGGAEAEAKRCIAEYLLEVRERPGVEALDGVDALAATLLAEQGAAGRLEGLLAAPNAAPLAAVACALRRCGRWHALALLSARRGDVEGALRLWQDLASGAIKEAPAQSGAVAEAAAGGGGGAAAVAVAHAAALLADEAAVADALALRCLDWLLDAAPDRTLGVLTARQRLPVEPALALLRRRSEPLLRSYLEHLVLDRGDPDAALHTELALALVVAALRLMPPPNVSMLAWQRACAARERDAAGGAAAEELRGLRGRLCALLAREPARYDLGRLLAAVAPTELWDEQVVLHQKLGDHGAALRVLALVLGDIRAAEAYCTRWAGGEGHLALLDALLRPGDGRPPLYAEACHLLAAQGAHLDPRRVLDALAPDMPLALAAGTLAAMTRTALHRRRAGTLSRALHRACHLSAAAERAELMSRRVVVTEERACRLCHARIGTKMSAVFPNGLLVCYKCLRKGDPHIPGWLASNLKTSGEDMHMSCWRASTRVTSPY
ncbi:hypothetical protein WJX81_003522 [Elliptochloris bilobata]|uniref:CNH domain-containing protein n=1 Tax=Elliptochloris bilobata TaxID=381761 RepID=A0AAW1S1G0_9CHLO